MYGLEDVGRKLEENHGGRVGMRDRGREKGPGAGDRGQGYTTQVAEM